MDKNDYIIHDLEVMNLSINYKTWVFDTFREHIGQRIVEIGAGIGTYTELMEDRERIAAVDVHGPSIAALERKFASSNNVSVIQADVSNPGLEDKVGFRADTVICLNVLEHIEDDMAALGNMHGVLDKGGKLLLLVPAHKALFGSVDTMVGHKRRYSKGGLRGKLERAGFTVLKLEPMNSLAVPGWYVNYVLLKKKHSPKAQVLAYDRYVIPWLSKLERAFKPPFGLSFAAVCKK